MITLIRSNSENKDFIQLVEKLDQELKIRDGEEYSFFTQFNKIDNIKYVVVAYENKIPVGCGAIKKYEAKTMEVKRMFVIQDNRRKGIASMVLDEIERWCKELGIEKCILETGTQQPEAICLYQKKSYKIIPNYGQYTSIETSVCFEKSL